MAIPGLLVYRLVYVQPQMHGVGATRDYKIGRLSQIREIESGKTVIQMLKQVGLVRRL